jgi:hypothetical protein
LEVAINDFKMASVTFTREELYDHVWALPLSKLATKFSISFHNLKKACVAMNVPIPDLGHWERVRLGTNIERKKLPANFTLRETTIEHSIAKESRFKMNLSGDPLFKVAERLTNPDKLILIAKDRLTKKDDYRYSRSIADTQTGDLAIRVSTENVSRALRIMDAFVKVMRERGYKIIVEHSGSYAQKAEIKIQFYLREIFKRIPKNDRFQSYEYNPTGKLCLTGVFGWRNHEWRDGREQIEDKFESIILQFEQLTQERIEQELQWKKDREIAQEKQRREEELKKLREKEIEEFRKLILKAKRWKHTNQVREYLREVEEQAETQGTMTEEVMTKLKWARQKANWLDPLLEAEDDLMKKIDRNTFLKEALSEKERNQGFYYNHY